MFSEHFDVGVVGAGISGIGAGHHLQTFCPRRSWAIFEARDALGGTWDLFRYPGPTRRGRSGATSAAPTSAAH